MHDEVNHACDVLLVRHGQTIWNAQRLPQSHRQVPLDEVGQAMAAALTQSPALEGVQAIYSSDLRRAMETVEPTARKLGLPIHTDMRLREIRGKAAPSDEYPLLPFPVERETREDLKHRALACLEDIAARHRGQRVLVMTHGGVIHVFQDEACKHEIDRLREPDGGEFVNINTAICHVRCHDRGRWSVIRLRDVDHLDGELKDGAEQASLT